MSLKNLKSWISDVFIIAYNHFCPQLVRCLTQQIMTAGDDAFISLEKINMV
jgi:hypothetical protein